jgi:hypothetical protein
MVNIEQHNMLHFAPFQVIHVGSFINIEESNSENLYNQGAIRGYGSHG